MWAMARRRPGIALVLLLSAAIYLRPSDMRKIRVGDVIRAIPQAGPARRFLGANMHQFIDEDSGCSKTGHFDEGVLLNLPKHRCITYLLAKLAAGRPKNSQLAPAQEAELEQFLKESHNPSDLLFHLPGDHLPNNTVLNCIEVCWRLFTKVPLVEKSIFRDDRMC